jgi:hypothetical protein
MQFQDIVDYIKIANDALGLLKAAYSLLPSGKSKEEIERHLQRAEELIKRSDATFAQKLGYPLCRCEWPPNIMLWKESEKAYVCSHCLHVEKKFVAAIPFAGGITD